MPSSTRFLLLARRSAFRYATTSLPILGAAGLMEATLCSFTLCLLFEPFDGPPRTIPFGKLMHFMRREDLATALGPATCKAIEAEAATAGEKFTSRFLKNYVANDAAIIDHLRGTELGQQAFDKYMANYRRITDPTALARGREVRKAMAGPRKGYLGCIATKVKPDDIRDCVDNFDNESYQSLELVPTAALRESAFRKTGNMALRSNAHISDLPRGLKQYIDSHPDEYEDYLDERKAEVEFLKSVRRNARHEWRKKQAKKENAEGSVSGEQSSKRRRDEDAESNWEAKKYAT